MIELELTYLAKFLPDNLKDSPNKKIIDLYVENGTDHADLRIRKNGADYELTRKTPVNEGDASKQEETTIRITDEEFESFRTVKNRKVEKTRYLFQHEGITAEFDVFGGDLQGLVVVDFEFDDEIQKNSFVMPDFCLADITQEEFIAGGMLAGKSFSEISDKLQRFGYETLFLA